MYIKLSDTGNIEQYPYNLYSLYKDYPNVSFPTLKDVSLATLAYYNIFPVKQSDNIPPYNPDTQYLEEDTCVLSTTGTWELTYKVVQKSEETLALEFIARLNSLQSDLQERLDVFAQERGYSSILHACSYISSTVEQFRLEAQKCIELRDSSWVALYDTIEKMKSGEISKYITSEEILQRLPTLTWNG